jgi:hypothetical protein
VIIGAAARSGFARPDAVATGAARSSRHEASAEPIRSNYIVEIHRTAPTNPEDSGAFDCRSDRTRDLYSPNCHPPIATRYPMIALGPSRVTSLVAGQNRHHATTIS